MLLDSIPTGTPALFIIAVFYKDFVPMERRKTRI